MKEMNLKIVGMMCEGCERRVKNALENINGVKKVTANHNTGSVEIHCEEEIDKKVVEEAIEDLGYEIVKE